MLNTDYACDNQVNTMATNTLAPCVTRSSATMTLTRCRINRCMPSIRNNFIAANSILRNDKKKCRYVLCLQNINSAGLELKICFINMGTWMCLFCDHYIWSVYVPIAVTWYLAKVMLGYQGIGNRAGCQAAVAEATDLVSSLSNHANYWNDFEGWVKSMGTWFWNGLLWAVFIDRLPT